MKIFKLNCMLIIWLQFCQQYSFAHNIDKYYFENVMFYLTFSVLESHGGSLMKTCKVY